ncbi:hypothetical protein QEJ31_11065 [Pigmentibacter sp. JX0631]|uniref:hypothetical protein n=1 Tax=Pigmentibacter sp. JX0631 TaxID=2976982 RepID=UPI0024690A1F|nr:hypothetical protein [Pigmentibacter sp. JX0631]WGL59059.1 hypothetical protein QEJ31_11065 [Pigmentibacter sp. JX0631]
MKQNTQQEDRIIVDTIKGQKISQQNELVEKLKTLGIDIPQSSLSRRLKKLGIAKINNYYTVLDQFTKTQSQILEIKLSQPNILVLHTLPGHANSLAIVIDEKLSFEEKSGIENGYKYLCGTIAGDDTVLVLSDGSKDSLSKLKAQIAKDFLFDETTD